MSLTTRQTTLRYLFSRLTSSLALAFALCASSGSSWGVTLTCGASSGTRFNLEARAHAVPQDQTTVDYLPGAGNGGSDLVVGGADDVRLLTGGQALSPDFRGIFGLTSQSGFYVHRESTDESPCTPDFEGGLPQIADPSGMPLAGTGYVTVLADGVRNVFFILDSRAGENDSLKTGIGLFRMTPAALKDGSRCPGGTLTEAQSAACLGPGKLVAESNLTLASPAAALDERVGGTGNIYIAATLVGAVGPTFISEIVVIACNTTLTACSSPQAISGSDMGDLASVAVRPDGGVTVTYTVFIKSPGIPAQADIKYVSCGAAAPPAAPSCNSALLIAHEPNPIPFDAFTEDGSLEGLQIVAHTYPKHAHRVDSNGIETYVIWERCKVSTVVNYPGLSLQDTCADSDLVMFASNDNGMTWNSAPFDDSPQHQIQAYLKTDLATNVVHVIYYSSQADKFQHRLQVMLREISPGGATPDPVSDPILVTSAPVEPNTDPFFQGVFLGEYPGIAVRTGAGGVTRAYLHFTHTAVAGTYSGIPVHEQNNHLSLIDFTGGQQ